MESSGLAPAGGREKPGRYFDPVVLARIKNLTLVARHVVEGLMAGIHRSALHGLSVEFTEHRPYVPGDELRRIDWKLFARQDRYFVKEYEAETNLKSYIFLDASASMGYGGPPAGKLGYGCYIAASLAYLMLLQRDAVGLVIMNDRGIRVVPPRSQPNHLRDIIGELERIEPGGATDIPGAVEEVAGKIPRRGLFIFISDFIDEPGSVEQALRHVQHRKNDMMAFHIAHRDELDLPFRKVTLFRDLEDGREITTDPADIRSEYSAVVQEHLEAVKAICHRHGSDYDLFVTDEPLHRSLVRYLARRGGFR